MNNRPAIILLAIILLSMTAPLISIGEQKPVNVIIIWHYHQPWYYSSNGSYFILPWVRMHSVGNYYKMGYILSKYPSVHVTFTFSGSLLVQLIDYVENHKMDIRQIISWKIAKGENLTLDEKFSMLQIPGGFFDINWNRIVNVVPRFSSLRDKAREAFNKYSSLPEEEMKKKIVGEFTDQDFLDLAVLFNLFWIDPEVLENEYPDLVKLRNEALTNPNVHFTRENLTRILEVQYDIMSKIIPLYKELAAKGQIELIPVPYSHPIAPLLVDFGWSEDLEIHVKKSIELFKEYFNYTPTGMWPAEEAVNDYALGVMASQGIKWVVTDENLLQLAGIDTTPENMGHPWTLAYGNNTLYVFFRNTDLSNRLGFQYSGWKADQAVNDLVNAILSLSQYNSDGSLAVVIALDGENPWENYEKFGDLFLNKLYEKLSDLQSKGLIKTITPREYLEEYSNVAKPLPEKTYYYFNLAGKDISDIDGYDNLPVRKVQARIAESSWAGLSGRLMPWIGDRQENAAWMWLAVARKTILDTLNVTSISEAYEKNPSVVEALLRAEASDWFWWYGGDMGSPETFDPLFKAYLRDIYSGLGLEIPAYLNASFYPDGAPVGVLDPTPPAPVKEAPKINGRLDAGEWSNSLEVPVGLKYISKALVAVDSENMYIALIPVDKSVLNDSNFAVAVYFWNPIRSVSPYHPGYNVYPRYGHRDLAVALGFEALITPYNGTGKMSIADGKGDFIELYKLSPSISNVVEVAIPWYMLAAQPNDKLYFTVAVFENKSLVETSTRLKLVYQVKVPRPTIAAGAKVVFEMNDPVGDDNGAGTYVYPTNNVFQPGVFDLTKFRVIDMGDRVVFEVYVKNLGDNPWNGPNDFCLQYPQIYVHTTLGDGNTSTFGLNVAIANDSAWHFALLLAPGWESDPVPKGQRAALYYANGTVVVQDGDFKVYGDPTRNAIIAEVSKKLLPDVEHIANWSYVVVVTSYDGYGPDRIRPFGVEAGEWTVGVGKELASAVAVGVIPRIMDLLAPTAEDQYKMLKSFKVNLETFTGTPAVIEAVGPTVQAKPTATTITTTTTITSTYTTTVEITKTTTITKTLTTTTTMPLVTTTTVKETITSPITVTTSIEKTETTTITQTAGGLSSLDIGLIIVIVILLIALAYLAAKKR